MCAPLSTLPADEIVMLSMMRAMAMCLADVLTHSDDASMHAGVATTIGMLLNDHIKRLERLAHGGSDASGGAGLST